MPLPECRSCRVAKNHPTLMVFTNALCVSQIFFIPLEVDRDQFRAIKINTDNCMITVHYIDYLKFERDRDF